MEFLNFLKTISNYAQVVVGLGLVIFVHELGHFLLAKWNGVKVEKFSIGFGPSLLAWRRGVGLRLLAPAPLPSAPSAPTDGGPAAEPSLTPPPEVGETEYTLAAIPLGGFVKMLGESPDEATKSTDPRAFPNKSVGARMAIVSAGVIMNVIFGLICFQYLYMRGGVVEEQPIIGHVSPGGAAYEAGIRVGDKVVAIDGQSPVSFADVRISSMSTGSGQKLHLELSRRGEESTYAVDIEPRIDAYAPNPRLGVASAFDLTLDLKRPYEAPPGLGKNESPPATMPMGGDRIVAVGPVDGEPEPVGDAFDIGAILAKYRDVPLQFVAKSTSTDGENVSTATPESRSFILPPVPMLGLGLRMCPGPVVSVLKGSPAERAGIQVGDVIVAVDGQTDFDPVRLPELLRARAGESVGLVIHRPVDPASATSKFETVTLTVTPEPQTAGIGLFGDVLSPLDVAPLGLAFRVEPKIAAVEPGSAAEKAGLKSGQTIATVTLRQPKPARSEPWPLMGKDAVGWINVIRFIQSVPEVTAELQIEGDDSKKVIPLQPTPIADWYLPDRGLNFASLEQKLPPMDFGTALKRSVRETKRMGLSVYQMIRGLVQGRLSRKLTMGPLGIFQAGSSMAGEGFNDLLHFLGLISVNLAVVNFLPIPPLDGGQMIFLIAEKIRGRPLPESAVGPVTILGLVFVLMIMVFVLFQDIVRIIQNYGFL